MHIKKNICYAGLWSVLLIGLVSIDLITKNIAFNTLKDNDSITLIRGFLSLTYVENRGAAWGMLSGKVNILAIVTVIIMPVFVFLSVRAGQAKKFLDAGKAKYLSLFQFDMIVLLAGALGNFADRIFNGFVVDFFQFTFIDFPVFNVADCYITAGAALFIIIYVFLLKDEGMDAILKGKKAGEDTLSHDEISD